MRRYSRASVRYNTSWKPKRKHLDEEAMEAVRKWTPPLKRGKAEAPNAKRLAAAPLVSQLEALTTTFHLHATAVWRSDFIEAQLMQWSAFEESFLLLDEVQTRQALVYWLVKDKTGALFLTVRESLSKNIYSQALIALAEILAEKEPAILWNAVRYFGPRVENALATILP